VAGVALTDGIGFTVIVNAISGPVQPSEVAVTFIVATIGALVVFAAVKDGILPDPLVPNPIFELLVQLNVAPAGVLAKFIAAPAAL
jgi:hypothetical protein